MNNDLKLLQDLINEYARSTGLSPLALDDTGRCSLRFDDKFSVTLQSQPDSGALVIFTELGALPADQELELCRQMLVGNYFWQHTAGLGTLALVPAEVSHAARNAVLLYQTPLQSLDYGTFQNRLSDFVDTAEAWMDYLRNFQQRHQSGMEPKPEVWLGIPMMRA